MKRLAVIGCAAALGVLATASVADAAAPEVTKKHCAVQTGTFTKHKETKFCTTVGAPYTETSQSFPSLVGPYRGDFHYVFTFQDTTTKSEIRGGEVTTTTTTQQLSRQVVPEDCYLTLLSVTQQVDPAECAAHGVYPPG